MGVHRLHAGVALSYVVALRVLAYQTRTNLDLVAQLQHALQNGAASHAALQLVRLLAGLVHVEGTDDDHVRRACVVANGNGNSLHDVLANDVDIVFQLRRDRNDGRLLRHRAGNEVADRVELDHRLLLLYQIQLVLEDDQVLELHDLHGRKVLARLGLRAGLVAGDQKESRIHDGGAVKHGRHEDVVSGTVDEGHVAKQGHGAAATGTFADGMGFCV